MGTQPGGRSDDPRSRDDLVWAFDGDGTRERWAAETLADDVDQRPAVLDGAGPGAGIAAHRERRLRRWANALAVAALAAAVLFGLARALRGDRTHRLILRDVQHVVQLEAQALAEGDRELYMSLQDISRRRLLRRPDVAVAERRADGPLPGVYFTDDPPRVTGIEVAAKDGAHTVEAVTATVQVAATDGAHVGRFEQARRMTHRADGGWQRAAAPAGTGAEGEVAERFVSSRIHASFPAADASLLRPLLERANGAVRAYCIRHGRCTGRARLAFGSADATAADVAFRMTAPSSPSGWQPADDAARSLLAFGIARAAALRLDYAYDRSFHPDGTLLGWPGGDGPDGSIVTALLDAALAAHFDPSKVDAWAADTTAAEAGVTLWHFGDPLAPERWRSGRRSGRPGALPRRSMAIAARSFAAATLRRDPERLDAAMATWPSQIAARRGDWLAPLAIERDFGARGLNAVLDWPIPQAPFTPAGAVVARCADSDAYVVDRASGVADLSVLACRGDVVAATAWSPDASALAVACHSRPSQAELGPQVIVSTLALVRAGASQGWRASRAATALLPATGTTVQALAWAPDGRHIALEATTWPSADGDGDADPVRHVRVLPVDVAAADPWTAHPGARPVPAVVHPATSEPVHPVFSAARLAWSPDGRTLAVAGHDGRIALQPADGGPATMLAGWAMAWSPEGDQIARIVTPDDAGVEAGGEVGGEAGGGVVGSVVGSVGVEAGGDAGGGAVARANASAARDTLALSVIDFPSLTESAAARLDGEAGSASAAGEASIAVKAADLGDVIGLAWSDDGRWVGAAFHLSTRCGASMQCGVGVAWQPRGSTAPRHAAFAPLSRQAARGWQWRGAWLPGTHRFALVNDESPFSDAFAAYENDAPGTDDDVIAAVLDGDTGRRETVLRPLRASLATLLRDYSPDGRWHARRDGMQNLVVEPAGGIGGFRAGEADTGWRFNRPDCSPHLAWSAGPS